MCLFHLLLLRQVFCRASTDNGFPVHQGTALLPNKMRATSGLALSQHKLPDFIPSVHTVLAALLSLGLSVFFPVPISAIQKRSLQLPVTSSFDNWKSKSKPECLQSQCTSWKETKNPQMLPCNTLFCLWMKRWTESPQVPSITASYQNTHNCSSNQPCSYCSSQLASR